MIKKQLIDLQTQEINMKTQNLNLNNLNLNDILTALKSKKAGLEKRFGVTSIGVFGSFAKGLNMPDSDVDIVLRMKKPDLFNMVHIKEELETDFQTSVDIVHYREKMNAFLKKRIDIEAVYV